MIETWRWFGPDDPVTLAHVVQAGATGVVSALHEVPVGEVWTYERVLERKRLIESAGLTWSVVESIPVHPDIKTRSRDWRHYVENYRESLRNVGAAGVPIVCYNFMAVIDWTRTSLDRELASGARALSFDMAEIAAYDLFILEREGAARDYAPQVREQAEARYRAMTSAGREQLERNIIAGLPGGSGSYGRADFRQALAEFGALGAAGLKENLGRFLEDVLPAAEQAGVHLCIHPDDPPFPLFGLPRAMSTADDARELFARAPSAHNGLTLCAGSFGARSDNDLVRMAREFGPRIRFVHLRNVRRQSDGSFYESNHLDGDNDMLGLISALMEEEERRRSNGASLAAIPMRPDHGHLIGSEPVDVNARPGYSFAGRLKGLAELRGVMYALEEQRRRERSAEQGESDGK